MTTPWPPLHAYAAAHRCPTCKAEPGTPCNAPGKNARLAKADALADRFGFERADHDPAHRMHASRQDAGIRHYHHDIAKAPWTEDRIPGQRYDSLGDAWDPAA